MELFNKFKSSLSFFLNFRLRHAFLIYSFFIILLTLLIYKEFGINEALSVLYPLQVYSSNDHLLYGWSITFFIIFMLILIDIVGLIFSKSKRKYFKNLLYFFLFCLALFILAFIYYAGVQYSSNFILNRTNISDLDPNVSYEKDKLIRSNNLKVTPYSPDLLDCYLDDNSDIQIKLIKLVGGDLILNNIGNNMLVYWGRNCTVVYLPSNINLNKADTLKGRAMLASVLIEKKYPQYINPSFYNNKPFSIKAFQKGIDEEIPNADAYTSSENNSIVIYETDLSSEFYPLAVILHEVVHTKSNDFGFSIYRETRGSGLEEGTTQLITQEIINSYFLPAKHFPPYEDQVEIVRKLGKVIGMENILHNFYNGDSIVVSKLLDDRSCPGTFMKLDEYLNKSIDTDSKEVEKEAINNAKKLLENPNCN